MIGQSSVILAARPKSRHWAISLAINASNASGVPPTGSTPSRLSRSASSTVRTARWNADAEIQALVAEGNTVVARWQGRVTHEGVFHGIPLTGKQISVCGINIYLIEDGKIAQEWEQMDSVGRKEFHHGLLSGMNQGLSTHRPDCR